MSESFAGRSVVITGAGRGLGRWLAEAFAKSGARVMIGARTISYAEDVREAIRLAGGEAEICSCDVSRHGDCIELVEQAAKWFGGIDIVIHCAADIPHGGLGHVADDKLEAGFASIAKAAWWLLEAARPYMAKSADGGRFIAIGSINGTATVVPNMTAYGMAKAALLAFVRSAALDVVEDRITVNAIQPGLIASDRARQVLGDEGLDAIGANVPVGRAGNAEDFAHACMFFASPKASYITGASLVMDGGSSISAGRGRGNDTLKKRLEAQQEH